MRIGMVGLKGIPFPGGIENFTEEVGWRLAARGHDVSVYVRPYVEVGDTYRGMRIRRLPSVNTKHLDALTHTFLASLHVLGSDLDVVHYHALGPSVFSWMPRVRGLKTIVQVHGLDWQRAKWSAVASACIKAAEFSAMHFPHRTMVISEALKSYFEAKYRHRVDYVPTGVNEYAYREPREITKWGLDKENYILFLARLVPEKGCHYLIQAYEALAPDKKLVIAGPCGSEPSYCEELTRHAGPNVIFTGAVAGAVMEELFANAYTFVVPSEIEGLSHALLQGLSSGRCVLASDIAPNIEALGGCGLTFRSGDVGDLRDQLQFLLDHPEFVEGCSSPAHARVHEHYAWDTVVDRLETVYADCCGMPVADLTSPVVQ
jgi:glycosyltransferase involved in cell wall biosynthesis